MHSSYDPSSEPHHGGGGANGGPGGEPAWHLGLWVTPKGLLPKTEKSERHKCILVPPGYPDSQSTLIASSDQPEP